MALHRSLVRSITTLKADLQFKAASQREEALRRFVAADALVAYLTNRDGDRDEKDRIYAALVRAVQAGTEWRDLAAALVWLGLWPGLDAIYGRRQRDFSGRTDELVTEISFILTKAIARLNLAGVNRVAATLVLNVDRHLVEALKRRWADAKCLVVLDDLTAMRHLESSRWRLTSADRELPVDAADLIAVRTWLAALVQGDADLVIGAALLGFDLHELADELGIGHEAARKRIQRAIRRIRRHLEKSR
jgi:RNA polymerase sigma-70 factor (ECF subfamily)